MRLPFREIATALQATSRNDIKCFARNGISDVTYATLSVIEQSNAATNPYFAISKSKTALEMVVLRILCHSAQRTLCHCEEQRDVAISRKGILVAFGSDMPTARYCFRSDIVFDSDICTAGKLWINTLALMKPKYNLHCKYNRSCPRCTIYDD